MTTPTEPNNPEHPQPAVAPAADAPTAQTPVVDAPTASVAPAPPPAAPMPPVIAPMYATGYPDPIFAPVARAPRTPWINPARRTSVIVISVVAALVLLGVGALIGWAVTPSHSDHGRQVSRFGPGPQGGQGGVRYGPGGGFGQRQGGTGGQRPAPSTPSSTPPSTPALAPTAAPSTSAAR